MKAYPNRVAIKSNVTTIATAGGNITAFKWNYDFVMSSFFHAEYDDSKTVPTDGKTWCSTFSKEVTAKALTLTAVNGFSGKTKCTW